MHEVFAELIRLVFHNDDDTPVEFVRELLCRVFGLRQREAIAFSSSTIAARPRAALTRFPLQRRCLRRRNGVFMPPVIV